MASICRNNNNNNTNQNDIPVVMRDARFRLGRALVTSGKAEEAISVFANLLEHARQTFANHEDNTHNHQLEECAIAYYEYGNALLRSYQQHLQQVEDEHDETGAAAESAEEDTITNATDTNNAAVDRRTAMAQAAEKRMASLSNKNVKDEPITTISTSTDIQSEPEAARSSRPDTHSPQSQQKEEEEDGKPTATVSSSLNTADIKQEEADDGDDQEAVDDEEEDDLTLALEMMETAWSILDKYVHQTTTMTTTLVRKYPNWCAEQLPRFLTGIGDVLGELERHADAADAYSRALQLRQEQQQAQSTNTTASPITQLAHKRKIVEAYVLIAQEFLACPPGLDVITSETQTRLCPAHERLAVARGYYDQARDQLQDTVVLMGELVATKQSGPTTTSHTSLEEEKENICFASTLVMGVGMQLAEQEELEQSTKGDEQPSKKVKRVWRLESAVAWIYVLSGKSWFSIHFFFYK